MPGIKKIKLSDKFKSVNILSSKKINQEPMTKLRFIISVLQGTIAVLTFTLLFTIYAAIVFLGHLNKIDIVKLSDQTNLIQGQIIYNNDKTSYNTEEMINLNIINNSNESIYLVPCQYFNKFEKKVSDKWQAISLAVCDETEFLADFVSIEKINKKAEDSIVAKKLGEGVWRGVSTVYFGCQKAQTTSCKNNQIIYTDEFVIGKPKIAVSVNPQL